MKTLTRMIVAKQDQWANEAILAAIQHGRKGGEFTSQTWANGTLMVTPVTAWATSAHAIPFGQWEALRASGWSYSFVNA